MILSRVMHFNSSPADKHNPLTLLLGSAGHRFDAVTALEVVEHVADQPAFVRSLAGITKDWGAVLVSTLSRTPQVPPCAALNCHDPTFRSEKDWLPKETKSTGDSDCTSCRQWPHALDASSEHTGVPGP